MGSQSAADGDCWNGKERSRFAPSLLFRSAGSQLRNSVCHPRFESAPSFADSGTDSPIHESKYGRVYQDLEMILQIHGLLHAFCYAFTDCTDSGIRRFWYAFPDSGTDSWILAQIDGLAVSDADSWIAQIRGFADLGTDSRIPVQIHGLTVSDAGSWIAQIHGLTHSGTDSRIDGFQYRFMDSGTD